MMYVMYKEGNTIEHKLVVQNNNKNILALHTDSMLLDPPPHKLAVGERPWFFPTTVTTLVMHSCCLERFPKTPLDKYRLCHADEAKHGRNSCPWSLETSLGDMVVDRRTMMATPWDWLVFPPRF